MLNHEVFGKVGTRMQLLIEEIKAVNLKGENVGLSLEKADPAKKKFSKFWMITKSKGSLMFQRIRDRWLKGDANSSTSLHVWGRMP